MTTCAELSLLTEERRVVNGEEHRHGWFVNGDGRQWLRILEVGYRITNLEALQANHGTDITRVHMIGLHMRHSLKGMQFLDLGLLYRSVAMGN